MKKFLIYSVVVLEILWVAGTVFFVWEQIKWNRYIAGVLTDHADAINYFQYITTPAK